MGSNKTLTADVRLIAATNQKSGRSWSKPGRFAKILFFRLRVVEIDLPPLRERTGDIPLAGAKFSCASSPTKTANR